MDHDGTQPGAPLRVLLVDDHDAFRNVVQRLLDSSGCVVVGARDGAEARSHATRGPWDVVIVDVGLPDVSGLELLRELAGSMGEQRPAFVVMSGRELAPTDVAHGCAILTKPFTADQLLATATAAVRAARAPGASSRSG